MFCEYFIFGGVFLRLTYGLCLYGEYDKILLIIEEFEVLPIELLKSNDICYVGVFIFFFLSKIQYMVLRDVDK